MAKTYFSDLRNKSKGQFWINNPSEEEVLLALDQGSTNCTTNPAYCSKLFQSEKSYITNLIDEVIYREPNIEKAAVEVYQLATKRLMKMFLPVYEASGGKEGFVTLQSDPRIDENFPLVAADVIHNRALGPNFMAKIPVINGGIDAINLCVELNIPICATEVFSIAQAVCICEAYEAAVKRTGNNPPIYVTHITGIYEEYLEKLVKREHIEIAPEVLKQAGLVIARKQYRLIKERGYGVTLLGGGARRMEHFTGIMGGDAHVTINWSTAHEIIESDEEFENHLDTAEDSIVVAELMKKLPDFVKAYEENGLEVKEFASFGPVQLFRNSFLKGWYMLLAEIADRKTKHVL